MKPDEYTYPKTNPLFRLIFAAGALKPAALFFMLRVNRSIRK
jgi:hypothetical protein